MQLSTNNAGYTYLIPTSLLFRKTESRGIDIHIAGPTHIPVVTLTRYFTVDRHMLVKHPLSVQCVHDLKSTIE